MDREIAEEVKGVQKAAFSNHEKKVVSQKDGDVIRDKAPE
jgi:hypothetical protein